MTHPTKESFLRDVADHKLDVFLDQGLYRHLQFGRPGSSNMYFQLITGPGFLLYRGDMGCYEFERLRDMFEFFRDDRGELRINKSYWAEKVEADSKFGNGIKEYSEEKLQNCVREAAKQYVDDGGLEKLADADGYIGDAIKDFEIEIESMLGSVYDENDAYDALRDHDFSDFECSAGDVFGYDYWEYDFKDYTYHYVWCCYAIVWGIQQYDQWKEEQCRLSNI